VRVTLIRVVTKNFIGPVRRVRAVQEISIRCLVLIKNPQAEPVAVQFSRWYSSSTSTMAFFSFSNIRGTRLKQNGRNENEETGHRGHRPCREIIEKNMKWIKIRCTERAAKPKCYGLSKKKIDSPPGFRIGHGPERNNVAR